MLSQFRTGRLSIIIFCSIWDSRYKGIYLYGIRSNIYCFRLDKQGRKPPHVSVWGLLLMKQLYLDSGADKRIYGFAWADIGIHGSRIEMNAERARRI